MEALFHKYLKKAKEDFRHGHLSTALEAVESAAFIQQDHVDVIYCRVEILRAQGRFRQAASCLQDALKLHPYRPLWVLDLADLLINRLQEPNLALDWLGRLMRCCVLTSLQKLRAFRLHIEALIDQDRLYEASLVLHNALAYYPRDLNLLFLRGWVYFRRNHFHEAVFAFHRVLRCDPDHADAHYYLGLAFSALGETRLMRCHFAHTFDLDRCDPPPMRFSASEFEQIIQQIQCDELFPHLPAFSIQRLPYPTAHLLADLDFDPRRFGVFLSIPGMSSVGPYTGFHLLLFQRNIERFCCSEREILEEIQQMIPREFAAYEIRHTQTHSLPAIGSLG